MHRETALIFGQDPAHAFVPTHHRFKKTNTWGYLEVTWKSHKKIDNTDIGFHSIRSSTLLGIFSKLFVWCVPVSNCPPEAVIEVWVHKPWDSIYGEARPIYFTTRLWRITSFFSICKFYGVFQNQIWASSVIYNNFVPWWRYTAESFPLYKMHFEQNWLLSTAARQLCSEIQSIGGDQGARSVMSIGEILCFFLLLLFVTLKSCFVTVTVCYFVWRFNRSEVTKLLSLS